MLSRFGRILKLPVSLNPLGLLNQSKSGGEGADVHASGSAVNDDQLGSISRSLLGMERRLDELNRTMSSSRADKSTIESLHEELQKSRQGLLEQAMRPLLLDIIGLHDRIDDRKQFLGLEGDTEDTGPLKMLTDIGQEVQDILELQGVTLFTEEGDVFNPARQRILATVPAPDETRIGQITRRFHPGYEIESTATVLRMEHVEAYRSSGS